MNGPTHQLAAIMFTDIVGYTSIMGRSEEKALQILAQNREIHEKYIAEYGGKLLKEMGDGNLVQFSSALDAVHCAFKIQSSAASILDAKLRIGIHLAEVIIQNDDVFGDGVNIASRIQAITDPGGIFVSESVQKAIRNRTDLQMDFLAEITLKNVDYPIKIYALVGENLPVTSEERLKSLSETTKSNSLKTTSIKKLITIGSVLAVLIVVIVWLVNAGKNEFRIAVLPVVNLTAMDEGKYVSAGMHSEMIDELSKLSSLMVTSRTSSSKYGNKDKSIPEIASELRVDLVVESELIEISDSLRIKIRLIQAQPEEKQLWRKEYVRSTKDILAVYGDIALEISQATNIDVTAEELSALISAPEIDPEAYQAYLTGMGHVYEFTPESINKAIQYFNLSLSLDSNYAPSYMGIALAWGVRMQFGYVSTKTAKPNILEATKKAMTLDSTSADTHYYLALNSAWFFWDWQEADQEFTRAIELAPRHAESRAYYAHYLNIVHRNSDAKRQIETAIELQPLSPTIRSLYGMHLNHSREYKKAIEVLQKTLREDPNYGMALSTLWTVYHNQKEYDKAIEIAKRLYFIKGENAVVDIIETTYGLKGYENTMEQIALAYIVKMDTVHVTPWQIATLFVRSDNKPESLNWLEKAYQEQDPNMPYINTDPIFDNVRSTDQFQDILDRMNLK